MYFNCPTHPPLSHHCAPVSAFNCKFSNEGCEDSKECCSGKCLQAHPGTNARCTRSSLHQSCLYTYQCEDRLTCGPSNRCCSKFWGTCSNHEDCCNPRQFCIAAEGFYYKRCLMGEVTSPNGGESVNDVTGRTSLLVTVILVALAVLCVPRVHDVL